MSPCQTPQHNPNQPYACIFLRGCALSFHDEEKAANDLHLAIVHQSLLALFDHPDLELHVRNIFVELFVSYPQSGTVGSRWLVFSPMTRIPRTFRRFSGLIYQKIQEKESEVDANSPLVQVIASRKAFSKFLTKMADAFGRGPEKTDGPSLESPLVTVMERFRCVTIFDDYDSMELPTNVCCFRPESLLKAIRDTTEDGLRDKILIVSVPVSWTSLGNLQFDSSAPFLPIVVPKGPSAGWWILLSRYRQKPHITCSRLIHGMSSLSREI
ncbi:3'-5' exonuclease [Perkinsela sp. CCAP 1560/4]|nr:3'-5' exonuclease [Perkinsela sp. CCAP 1560/4]|eukprot:KNH07521.1 3'-5' exonuclease [Perkinsela sp. CCAP 1560/4]